MKTAKAVVAAIGGIAAILNVTLADNVLNMDEKSTIISTVVIQAITVYGVWKTRNKGYVDNGE